MGGYRSGSRCCVRHRLEPLLPLFDALKLSEGPPDDGRRLSHGRHTVWGRGRSRDARRTPSCRPSGSHSDVIYTPQRPARTELRMTGERRPRDTLEDITMTARRRATDVTAAPSLGHPQPVFRTSRSHPGDVLGTSTPRIRPRDVNRSSETIVGCTMQVINYFTDVCVPLQRLETDCVPSVEDTLRVERPVKDVKVTCLAALAIARQRNYGS